MIALDTNLLLYAHRADSEWHANAAAQLTHLAESGQPWSIPWPCIHEFFSIATHPRIFSPPSTPNQAGRQIEYWMESPSLQLLGESEDHWQILSKLIVAGRIAGPRIHDARIAAICIGHGIQELWSADRDFTRISGLRVRNPLLSPRSRR